MALEGNPRTVLISDEDNHSASRVKTYCVLSILALSVQIMIGLGTAGTGMWALITTRDIHDVTGEGFRSPIICTILLAVAQACGACVGLAAIVGKMMCIAISFYSLNVAMIICLLVNGLQIFFARKLIADEVTLKFNRIDSDVLDSLENDFDCGLNSWSATQGSNSTELYICEDKIEMWVTQSITIVLCCILGNILSLICSLLACWPMHNNHFQWKTRQQSNVIVPQVTDTAIRAPQSLRGNADQDMIDALILNL